MTAPEHARTLVLDVIRDTARATVELVYDEFSHDLSPAELMEQKVEISERMRFQTLETLSNEQLDDSLERLIALTERGLQPDPLDAAATRALLSQESAGERCVGCLNAANGFFGPVTAENRAHYDATGHFPACRIFRNLGAPAHPAADARALRHQIEAIITTAKEGRGGEYEASVATNRILKIPEIAAALAQPSPEAQRERQMVRRIESLESALRWIKAYAGDQKTRDTAGRALYPAAPASPPASGEREAGVIERVKMDSGEVDEVVGRGAFHLEVLDDDAVYLGLADAQLWIAAVDGRIRINHEGLADHPQPSQPAEEEASHG